MVFSHLKCCREGSHLRGKKESYTGRRQCHREDQHVPQRHFRYSRRSQGNRRQGSATNEGYRGRAQLHSRYSNATTPSKLTRRRHHRPTVPRKDRMRQFFRNTPTRFSRGPRGPTNMPSQKCPYEKENRSKRSTNVQTNDPRHRFCFGWEISKGVPISTLPRHVYKTRTRGTTSKQVIPFL